MKEMWNAMITKLAPDNTAKLELDKEKFEHQKVMDERRLALEEQRAKDDAEQRARQTMAMTQQMEMFMKMTETMAATMRELKK